MDNETDWMSDDAVQEQRREQHAKAVEFAREHYGIFETERGKALLKHWEESVLRKTVPVESPVQVYAAHEGERRFILGIKEQVRLAKEEPE